MPIGSLSMRASNITLILIGVALIFFGFFVYHRVTALAENIALQEAKNKAIFTGANKAPNNSMTVHSTNK